MCWLEDVTFMEDILGDLKQIKRGQKDEKKI